MTLLSETNKKPGNLSQIISSSLSTKEDRSTSKRMAAPYPCIKCKQEVRPRQEALLCDSCDEWQHRTCNSGITRNQYHQAVKDGADMAVFPMQAETRCSAYLSQWHPFYIWATCWQHSPLWSSSTSQPIEWHTKAVIIAIPTCWAHRQSLQSPSTESYHRATARTYWLYLYHLAQ